MEATSPAAWLSAATPAHWTKALAEIKKFWCSFCRVRANWQRINDAVLNALTSITLEEMAQPFGVLAEPHQNLVHLTSLHPQ